MRVGAAVLTWLLVTALAAATGVLRRCDATPPPFAVLVLVVRDLSSIRLVARDSGHGGADRSHPGLAMAVRSARRRRPPFHREQGREAEKSLRRESLRRSRA